MGLSGFYQGGVRVGGAYFRDDKGVVSEIGGGYVRRKDGTVIQIASGSLAPGTVIADVGKALYQEESGDLVAPNYIRLANPITSRDQIPEGLNFNFKTDTLIVGLSGSYSEMTATNPIVSSPGSYSDLISNDGAKIVAKTLSSVGTYSADVYAKMNVQGNTITFVAKLGDATYDGTVFDMFTTGMVVPLLMRLYTITVV